MKNTFKGFYNPTEKELMNSWISGNTVFIFDTSVLLNLYSYAEKTRNDFYSVVESLQNKVWIPYQVGLEYQYRRLSIIKNEKFVFSEINNALEKLDKIFTEDINKLTLEKRFPKLHENTEKLHKDILKLISSYSKSVNYWDDKQPCVRSHDHVREKINKLFESKIGNEPNDQEWLNKLYEEGEIRYKAKIPPGFNDNSKSKSDEPFIFYNNLKYERKFGDLILWKQIIEKSKTENIKNVIFVTDDNKDDWWYILNSRGKKQIGPHANLQCEIYREANLDIFHMYNTSSFLEDGKKNLKIIIDDKSIEDANVHFWNKIENNINENLSKHFIFNISNQDIKNALNQKFNEINKNNFIQNDCLVQNKLYDLINENIDENPSLSDIDFKNLCDNFLKSDLSNSDKKLFVTYILNKLNKNKSGEGVD